ncbi:GLIS1_3 [Acanthosepion pharaonis]|uniref:GLIS1_3 n=1 Tax=Acanthosepion pharaonis TaxID=158019 RepID=A0A812E0R2_ACAPH|nr:GLIS1_3 [Sepia pharaonis]
MHSIVSNNNLNEKASFLEPSPCRIDGNKKLLPNSLRGHDLSDTNFLSGNDNHPLTFDTSKSLSPYCLPENPPTPFSFSNSPRHSANMSSRLSGKTTSPLCIDGVELTTLIRVSPSSLSSSRISSASFSPQYIGHLSARSCGTPNSGSGSSGSRNFNYMSQGTISNMKREIDFHTGPNNLESYLLPSSDSKDPFMKNQLVIPYDQIPFVEQMCNSQHIAFLESEQSALAFPDSSAAVSSTATVNNNNNSNPNHISTSNINVNNTNNNTVTNANNITSSNPLVSSAPGSIIATQANPSTNSGLHIRPPPSYAQALQEQKRKQQSGLPYVAPCLQSPASVKTEPFEDGEKRQVCKWIDCNAVFDEQDELVRHIEKMHIDQRKAEDFTCFWQGCLRRLKPFNASQSFLLFTPTLSLALQFLPFILPFPAFLLIIHPPTIFFFCSLFHTPTHTTILPSNLPMTPFSQLPTPIFFHLLYHTSTQLLFHSLYLSPFYTAILLLILSVCIHAAILPFVFSCHTFRPFTLSLTAYHKFLPFPFLSPLLPFTLTLNLATIHLFPLSLNLPCNLFHWLFLSTIHPFSLRTHVTVDKGIMFSHLSSAHLSFILSFLPTLFPFLLFPICLPFIHPLSSSYPLAFLAFSHLPAFHSLSLFFLPSCLSCFFPICLPFIPLSSSNPLPFLDFSHLPAIHSISLFFLPSCLSCFFSTCLPAFHSSLFLFFLPSCLSCFFPPACLSFTLSLLPTLLPFLLFPICLPFIHPLSSSYPFPFLAFSHLPGIHSPFLFFLPFSLSCFFPPACQSFTLSLLPTLFPFLLFPTCLPFIHPLSSSYPFPFLAFSHLPAIHSPSLFFLPFSLSCFFPPACHSFTLSLLPTLFPFLLFPPLPAIHSFSLSSFFLPFSLSCFFPTCLSCFSHSIHSISLFFLPSCLSCFSHLSAFHSLSLFFLPSCLSCFFPSACHSFTLSLLPTLFLFLLFPICLPFIHSLSSSNPLPFLDFSHLPAIHSISLFFLHSSFSCFFPPACHSFTLSLSSSYPLPILAFSHLPAIHSLSLSLLFFLPFSFFAFFFPPPACLSFFSLFFPCPHAFLAFSHLPAIHSISLLLPPPPTPSCLSCFFPTCLPFIPLSLLPTLLPFLLFFPSACHSFQSLSSSSYTFLPFLAFPTCLPFIHSLSLFFLPYPLPILAFSHLPAIHSLSLSLLPTLFPFLIFPICLPFIQSLSSSYPLAFLAFSLLPAFHSLSLFFLPSCLSCFFPSACHSFILSLLPTLFPFLIFPHLPAIHSISLFFLFPAPSFLFLLFPTCFFAHPAPPAIHSPSLSLLPFSHPLPILAFFPTCLPFIYPLSSFPTFFFSSSLFFFFHTHSFTSLPFLSFSHHPSAFSFHSISLLPPSLFPLSFLCFFPSACHSFTSLFSSFPTLHSFSSSYFFFFSHLSDFHPLSSLFPMLFPFLPYFFPPAIHSFHPLPFLFLPAIHFPLSFPFLAIHFFSYPFLAFSHLPAMPIIPLFFLAFSHLLPFPFSLSSLFPCLPFFPPACHSFTSPSLSSYPFSLFSCFFSLPAIHFTPLLPYFLFIHIHPLSSSS